MSDAPSIVHLVRRSGRGTGVGAVAEAIHRGAIARGERSVVFTVSDTGFGTRPPSGRFAAVVRAVEIVWFSTVGTWIARRRYPVREGWVRISHNDAMVGQVHVNHGVLREALRRRRLQGRGRAALNPLHLFLLGREWLRYRMRLHRVIVCLSSHDEQVLVENYPRARGLTRVIPNGIDLTRYAPVGEAERGRIRESFGVSPDQALLVFVGHEFERKGLMTLLEAMTVLEQNTVLRVVGGTPTSIERARARSAELGVDDRVTFAGPGDPAEALMAAEMLVLPSRYEAWSLVLGEALASGTPIITGVSGAGEGLLAAGAVGAVTDVSAAAIAVAVRRVLAETVALGHEQTVRRCREVAARFDWRRIVEQYLALAREFAP